MSSNVDLSQLAVRRERQPSAPRRRQAMVRFALPGLLLAGFVALVGYAARETLSPPRLVTVMPVTTTATLDAPADSPLFRAAGWAEPRPTPSVVTAMAEGVVEQLLVVEGQEVKRGQTVARLVEADARLLVEAADAEVELREGDLSAAHAVLTSAKARLELPVHLHAELADAESALAKAESELAGLPGSLTAAEARAAYARREFDVARRSGAAVSAIGLDKAKTDVDVVGGSVRELQTRQKRLPVEIAALTMKRDAQRHKLDRKVEERRHLGEAEAGVKSAAARLRLAKSSRDAAKLRLDRMEVKSPASGRVLALIARPGTRLNGLAANSLQDSSTVLTLYDPASLQVRVDVRLDDVGKVRAGQKVRIETAALPEQPLEGEVLLATSQADIQKNTLAVKVAIRNPPATLKPEMLCQVTFLAPPKVGAASATAADRMLVPRQLVESGGLWVVDQVSGTARFRAVELGLSAGDLVEVVRGLASSDKLIVAGRDGLKEGTRVRVSGEDETLGIGSTLAGKKGG